MESQVQSMKLEDYEQIIFPSDDHLTGVNWERNVENEILYIEYLKRKEQQNEQTQSDTGTTPNVQNDGPKQIESIQKQFEPEQRQYMIVNSDTGEVVDARTFNVVAIIKSSNAKNQDPALDVLKSQVWKDFWTILKQFNEDLLNAAELGRIEIVQQLLDPRQTIYPVDLNTQALDDWTPLHFACIQNHIQIARLLIDKGCNIEARTSFNRTPMHLACLKGNFDIVVLLIEKKCDINCQDKDFCTPLHYSAENGFEDIVRVLLQSGADPQLKNYQGTKGVDASSNPSVLQVFQELGIKSETLVRMGDIIYNHDRKFYIGRINSTLQKGHGSFVTPSKQQDQQSDKPTEKPQNEKFQGWINQMNTQVIDFSKEKVDADSFFYYKQLGKGSFGEVYLVQHQEKCQYYALQVLKKDKIISNNLTRYAQTEQEVLNIMEHPFIVGLSYAFQTESRLFLAMTFCPGGDLGSMLEEHQRFSEDVAQVYIAQILLALQALHQRCIIYRDLKPENVVLDATGHAMLTDFGLAKQGTSDLDIHRSFCGTPAYLAPEMLARTGHNRQVDWYLLGVLLYELLVGLPPYFDQTKEKLFENIKSGPLKLPRSLSDDAKDLIKQLLNRNPNQRLGAQRDGQEIREHQFFRDINWDDLYNKKYTNLPRPVIMAIPNTPIPITFSSSSSTSSTSSSGKPKQNLNIQDWSVADPDNSNRN